MTDWADVAGKAVDFLQRPSGWSVAIVALMVLFAICVAPTWFMAKVADKNTDRLERAINALGQTCMRSAVAGRGGEPVPE